MSKDKFGLASIKAEGSCRIYDENYDFESIKTEPPEFKTLSPSDWRSYLPAPTTQYVCHCGSKKRAPI